MGIETELVANYWIWLSWAVQSLLILLSCWKAPWHKLKESDSLNVFLGAIVVLLFFWNLKAGIYPGQTFHFLGATVLCLMFGWPFALIATQLLTLIVMISGQGDWQTLALNGLIMGAVPICVTQLLLNYAQNHLPHHFFIYIFINSFLAAALGISFSGLATYTVLSSSGAYPIADLNQQLFPVYLLLALPEGLLNGSVMTLLVVYRPDWVATFHDKTYLSK